MPRRLTYLVLCIALTGASGCVDTNAPPEPAPSVQQPDWSQQPIHDTTFGGDLSPEPPPPTGENDCKGMGWSRECSEVVDDVWTTYESLHELEDYTSVTNGGGDVFVSAEDRKIVRSYDGTTLAHKQSFSHPELTRPRALTYYRGELFVLEPGEIYVFDAASGAFKRRFTVPDGMVLDDVEASGIDAAWNELWITLHGTSQGGAMAVLDAQTGTVKSAHWHMPTWSDEGPAGGAWSDLAVVPEEMGAIAQCRFVQRGTLLQPAPLEGDLGTDLLADSDCDEAGGQDGVDAVWGMRWYLTVLRGTDGTRRIREYGIDPDRTKPYLTPLRRSWQPAQGGSYHAVRYDVAYQARETRIDWSGPLKTKDWLRGTKCANYVVSDGDIFVTGKTAERWYEPARGFQKIELRFDGVLQDTKTTASGQLCGNTASVPSGVRTVELRAYVNNGTKTVTATNAANFDNTAPTGVLDPTAGAVRGTVALAGSVTDEHSHPHRWRPQILRNGSWQNLCDELNDQPDQVTHPSTCNWNTTSVPDGHYQLRVESLDLASDGGNVGHSGTRAISVDNTPPDFREPAPALGSPVGDTVDDPITDVIGTQTDATSGVAQTVVEVNAAPDGSASGNWLPAGSPMTDSPDGVTEWDTSALADGLYRMRATTSDRAGNTRTTEWQIVLSAARQCPESAGKPGNCFAGTAMGEPVTRGSKTFQYGSRGARAGIQAPSVSSPGYPTGNGTRFSLADIGIAGLRGTRRFLQVGLHNPCEHEAEGFNYWTHATYNNKNSEQSNTCFYRTGTRRQFSVVIRDDKMGLAMIEPQEGGRPRVVAIDDTRSEFSIGKTSISTTAFGETNSYKRGIGGTFHRVEYVRPLASGWRMENVVKRLDRPKDTYHSEYVGDRHGNGGNPGYFCVHSSKNTCNPPSP